ncbi:hypothetical protein BJ322DRAFT_1109257 [Thelephora terrestris]|uniref:Ribonuclease H1 N-terminal domain-containing protein n=1 Tax=Thelephora terrestris TaxID=56493 RepID=A0A9P6L687_9AGAM|nr:hypothetical protein BJ322DRAFT_1109257 [Thelephora terrestris]
MPRATEASRAFIGLSTDSAFSMCDGLLRMSHSLMVELPEPELRDIRYLLSVMVARADHLLDAADYDISLNFNGLAISQDALSHTWPEDFGAVLISTTVSSTSEETRSTASSRRARCGATGQPSARPPTPVPTPTTVPLMHGPFPLVISSRDNVGIPDYTNHPHFVRPGIPGAYLRPPTDSGLADQPAYYIISKGLYLGVFNSWDEVAPWVIGVSGSVFRKTTTWEEARDLYNSRLAAGAVKVLS